MFIHLVVIAWLYVAVMMAVAEATNTNGTVLGAIVTFVLYGLLPVGLLVYLLSTPARRRLLREREEAQRQAAIERAGKEAREDAPREAREGSVAPDQGGEAAADAVAPVRKEP